MKLLWVECTEVAREFERDITPREAAQACAAMCRQFSGKTGAKIAPVLEAYAEFLPNDKGQP